ncbi:S-layer homology domain-containing protein [Paenibacillus sp. YN15]|uniref:S-layer homology domain-containing protein n=1 Tax=Paenibacillus sp. YN15 TaxID=1742774 RepID=UPI000DCC2ADC|nr:S-layer homology domain-containing protein [Paenibacillus sp. YN15]RAU91328.1 hypothetical protein DQG13_29610 [Paenibacillus sp. YN15]
MKAKLLEISICLLMAMLALTCALGPAGTAKAEAEAAFSLSADKFEVSKDDDVIIILTGSGLISLISFEAALQYSEENLEYVGMETLDGAFSFETKKASGGFSVVSANFGYVPALSGSHELVKLKFKVKEAGNAVIELVKVQFMNQDSQSILSWDEGDRITLSFAGSEGGTPEEPGSSGNEQPEATEQPRLPVQPNGPAEEGVVIIAPETAGAGSYVLQLPTAVLNDQDAKASFEIRTDIGTLLIPGGMLANAASGEESIGIRISRGDPSKLPVGVQSAIGHHPVLELDLIVDGQPVAWNNPKAPVTVMIDYALTAAELLNPDKIVVWYVDSQGLTKVVPNGRYDPAAGKLVFKASHSGTYAPAYAEKTFGDLAEAEWARQAVEAMAAREVLQGTAEEAFSPQQPIKRGDFMLILARALELEGLGEAADKPFADVAADAYYAEAVNTARQLGIAQGGGNAFHPQDGITREDAMVLFSRALDAKGIALGGAAAPPEGFADQADFAEYARQSISALAQAGIIEGYDGALHPKQPLTRVQAAVLMYRVLLPH